MECIHKACYDRCILQAQRLPPHGRVGAAPGAPGRGHVPRARARRRLEQGGPRPARAARPAARHRPAQPRRDEVRGARAEVPRALGGERQHERDHSEIALRSFQLFSTSKSGCTAPSKGFHTRIVPAYFRD